MGIGYAAGQENKRLYSECIPAFPDMSNTFPFDLFSCWFRYFEYLTNLVVIVNWIDKTQGLSDLTWFLAIYGAQKSLLPEENVMGISEEVEIQKTFYQPPQEKTEEKWRNQAPSDFEFTLRAW